MRRPLSRARKIVASDDLVELFRRAWPLTREHWRAISSDRELSFKKLAEITAATNAFDLAAGVKPWQQSPLTPFGAGPLQDALLAKLDEGERKAWHRSWRTSCR